jgi:hypothetical protein
VPLDRWRRNVQGVLKPAPKPPNLISPLDYTPKLCFCQTLYAYFQTFIAEKPYKNLRQNEQICPIIYIKV